MLHTGHMVQTVDRLCLPSGFGQSSFCWERSFLLIIFVQLAPGQIPFARGGKLAISANKIANGNSNIRALVFILRSQNNKKNFQRK
jgi:hypothetical protein